MAVVAPQGGKNLSNEKETTQEQKNEQIVEMEEAVLGEKRNEHVIYLLSIIGEIEGHDCLPATSKTSPKA